jgi:2',3'-cyclic-nucleotide 2'-phosphodiesterase (5'-nucleotidase family)
MPVTLQILHASDFEAGISALNDAVGFSAILEAFRNNDVANDFRVDDAVLNNTLTLSSGDNYIPGPFFNASSDTSLNGVGGLTTSNAPTIGRADVGILNAFGIQASAFGNHEFDLGTRQVRDILRSGAGNPSITITPPSGPAETRGLNFPYLSTNLDFGPDENLRTELASDQNTAEATSIKGRIAKSTIVTLPSGEKVGIVGATTPTLRSISSPGQVGVRPSNPIDFAALAADIQTSVDALKNAGINKIILLSHMQQLFIERDELAPRLRDVDIIIAGGSHTPLLDNNDRLRPGTTDQGDYPILRKDADNRDVLVLNTDANYRYVGRLVVEFNDDGTLNTSSLNDVSNGAFATDEEGVDRVHGRDVNPKNEADSRVVAITDALRAVIAAKDNNISGQTNFFLNGTRDDVRTQETNLGNVTADANLAYTQTLDPTVVISLKNGGGIRDNIGVVSGSGGATNSGDVRRLPPQPNDLAPNKPVGAVSQLDIENSLRFNNGLTLITVTAQQLKVLMEHGVAGTRSGATPGQFPQVGGLSFSFDPSRTAQVLDSGGNVTTPGQRVQSLAITNAAGKITDVVVENGEVIGNPDRTFRMVTLDFLAGTTPTSGGDGYPFPQIIASNPTRANRVDLRGETTVDLNGNGRIDGAVAIPNGRSTFTGTGSEQDALAEFLFQVDTIDIDDTSAAQDRRIQNLSARQDTVFQAGRQLTARLRGGVLRGTENDDILIGLRGEDVLIGLAGNDEVDGGGGDDRLRGKDGQDRLAGGLGDNGLLGGRGRDLFVLEEGRGRNVIQDFQDGRDRLELSDGLRFRGLSIEQSGNNTLISNGNDLFAVLWDIDADRITAADFVRA